MASSNSSRGKRRRVRGSRRRTKIGPNSADRPASGNTFSLVSGECGSALDECHVAISLVEVTQRSLESLEIAQQEQEVLRRALKSIWFVHDWIYELRPQDVERERQGDES